MEAKIQNIEIIETDEDTKLEDREEDSESLYPYDPTKKDIDIREDPHTVYELMRKYDKKTLIIDPEFQRNLVWKPEQKSRFIESVILNFPLPPWYVNQTRDGKYIIIDGLQRTTALHEFINGEFSLKGLEALPKLNGCNFSSLEALEGSFQVRIEDKKLLLYVVKPSVPTKVVHDLFYRINTAGTKLERQEVRNCIFAGKSTRLLKELSEADCFRKAINNGISSTRMKDREAVLRYLAFHIFDYGMDYHGDMSDFLEKTMKKINLMHQQEIDVLKEEFMRVMNLTYEFFGDTNFRLQTKVNIAILESVCCFFSGNSSVFLKSNKDKIIENCKKLLADTDYIDAVKDSTGSKAKVSMRFSQVRKILGNI